MFTGIIQEVGTVAAIRSLGGGIELDIACTFAGDTHEDESIAVDGVCQTVTKVQSDIFTVQSVEETLRKTTLGSLKQNDPVNLERSLTMQQGIEGHLVQGHVDTTGVIKQIEQEGTNWLYTIEYDEEWLPYIVGRGSIAIDGISLTVARQQDNQFTVAIIPYTRDHTNLNAKSAGDSVNLEFDMLGKYVVRFLETRGLPENTSNITESWLKEQGFGTSP
ncbi:MAG: riboflavin synthase [Bacteroidota bacterium]